MLSQGESLPVPSVVSVRSVLADALINPVAGSECFANLSSLVEVEDGSALVGKKRKR